MICPSCGTSNVETSSICVNCGKPLHGAPAAPASPMNSYTPPPPPPSNASYIPPTASGPQVPNYLIQAILVTLCCCLPFGIVAIVYAAQVNTKLTAGDYSGAAEASRNAKMWCWIALGVGLLAQLIWILYGGLAFIQGLANANS